MIVARTIRGRGWRTHYVEAPAERDSLSLCGVGGAWLPTRGEEPTCPVCRSRRAKAVREMMRAENERRAGR